MNHSLSGIFSSDAQDSQAPQFSKFSRFINQLSIGSKIRLGYTIALSVAVIGTATGFKIGDYYQRQALTQREHDQKELRLLNRIQVAALQLQNHHQRVLLPSPGTRFWREEYTHLFEQVDALEDLWQQLRTHVASQSYRQEHHAEGIPRFLETYNDTPAEYLRQLQVLPGQIKPETLNAEQIRLIKKQLLAAIDQPPSLKLLEALDALEQVINASYKDLRKTEANILAAEKIRLRIILISIGLSITIATLLAIFTSRAISRPILALTDVAQQATQHSNFDLQAPVTTQDEIGVLATSFNQLIDRVKTLLAEQKSEADQQLIQSEKMSSLGQMLAGVAHEINNPVNFIAGNLKPIQQYFEDLLSLIDAYTSKVSEEEIQTLVEEIDLEFLKEDLAKILRSNQLGADRINQIVLSLKNFSRLEETAAHTVDLHDCIDSTLLILNNRIKQGIEIVKNYGEIPAIEGYSGSLYQVFMNILSNAMDALNETNNKLQEITITTDRLSSDQVLIKISDNGAGISPAHLSQIFESFFTTKPIGVGTGLGLSISHQIITTKHGGTLTCESELGKGTTFAIVLPIQRPESQE
jgi:two-component system, NtrC family, sensor kinase